MGSILEELDRLRKTDRRGMLERLQMYPEDCRNAVEMAKRLDIKHIVDRHFKAVVFSGVGGSAIGGQLIKDWINEESKIPLIVSRGYHLPGFVDQDALVFSVSYSGNTEETLSAFHEAFRRRATVISLTSGGLLGKLSKEKGITLALMPTGLLPRAALPYQFFMIATIMNRLGLIGDSWREVDEAIEILGRLRDDTVPEVPIESNPAKRLASSMMNKVPFIYGARLFEGVAYRLGTQLNENSKVPAASGSFPELFHNAVMGSEAPDEVLSSLFILIIKDPEETEAMTRKIDRFEALLEPRVAGLLEVRARGKGKLARMFSVIYLGDYASAYLGLLYGKDPNSMDAIIELKRVQTAGFTFNS